MPITSQTATQIASHVLAGNPDGRDLLSLSNDALQRLSNARPWNWQRGTQAELPGVSGDAFVLLPPDYSGDLAVQVVQETLGLLRKTTLTELLLFRSQFTVVAGPPWWWAIEYAPIDATISPEPKARMALYPPVSTDLDPMFHIYYTREIPPWTEVGDTAAAIPEWMTLVLQSHIRATARGWEDDLVDPIKVEEYLAVARGGSDWKDAIRRDSTIQSSLGRPTKGMMHGRGRYQWPITPPVSTS